MITCKNLECGRPPDRADRNMITLVRCPSSPVGKHCKEQSICHSVELDTSLQDRYPFW